MHGKLFDKDDASDLDFDPADDISDDRSDSESEDDAGSDSDDPTTQSLKRKRHRYTDQEKRQCLQIIANSASQEEGLRRIRKISGFDKVHRAHIRSWKKESTVKKTAGRKADANFEGEVLSHLIFTILQKNAAGDVAYSYDIIKSAAKMVQALPHWKDDQGIQKLKFSNHWVVGFLRRNSLRRRRVTTFDKQIPAASVIRSEMQKIQRKIREGGFPADCVLNADETGINYGAQPKNQYVPNDAARAKAPEGNDKARFTDLVWATSAGDVQAPFLIIKNSTSGADQTSSTILDEKHLMKEKGFSSADGWERKLWSRELTLQGKNKKETTIVYKRHYLIHAASGAIITANSSAWMDSVCMAMWIDLQLGPWVKRKNRPVLLIMDNCGPHNVTAIRDIFRENKVEVMTLPPNTTALLQPMDLVVNGPLKSALRRERIRNLHNAFLQFKADYAIYTVRRQNNPSLRPPAFDPPKPSIHECLRFLLNTCQKDMCSSSFKDGVKRSFIDVGLALGDDGTFNDFKVMKRHGTITSIVAKEHATQDPFDSENSFTLADATAIVELTGRPLEEDSEIELLDEIQE